MAKTICERPTKMTTEEKKYQAEDDLRTLRRAEEVKMSKNRLEAAKVIAKQEIKALNKIQKRK